MAEKHNATCSICGKPYYVCMSCKDSMQLHPYKNFTDTAEHYKVFQVVRGFSTGVYDKDEFKSKLKNIDLSDLDSYRPHIKDLIQDALKEEAVIETSVVEATPVSRKRNYKINKVEVNENVEDKVVIEDATEIAEIK